MKVFNRGNKIQKPLEIALLLFGIVIIILASCVSPASQSTSEDNFEERNFRQDETLNAWRYADSVMNQMTLEERIGQCFMPSLKSDSEDFTIKKFQRFKDDFHVGGIVLLQGDIPSAKFIANLSEGSKVPLFISMDAEWGLGMRLKDAPIYPKNGRLNEDIEETLMYDYGREIAAESRKIGINMILGPVIDINATTGSGIGQRSFGSDPKRVSNLGIAYAKGLESGGVISVAKHFPGHGNTLTDSHKSIAVNPKNITYLDTIDFLPFKEYIKSGLTGIMAGHIVVPSVSRENKPASVSENILQVLLREEMGFKGLILTDAFNMSGIDGYNAWDAIKAGADIILCPLDIEIEIKELQKKINSGEFDARIIADRCRRIIFYKVIFGLWHPDNKEIKGRGDSISIDNLKQRLSVN